VLDALDEPVVVVGRPYHVVEVNAVLATALGVPRDRMLGAPMPTGGGETPARAALDGAAFDAEVCTERTGPAGVRQVRQRTVLAPDSQTVLAVMLDHTEADSAERASAQHRAAISELSAQLHRVAGQLVEAREHERASITRALHDDTLQRLAALRWELAGDEHVSARLEECYEAVRGLIRRVRAETTEGGLGAMLDDLAGRAPVACSVSHDLRDDVDDKVADVVWRGVREAIRAAVLRRAGHVVASVRAVSGVVTAEVRDDGHWEPGDGAREVRRIMRAAGGRVAFRRRERGAVVTMVLGVPAAGEGGGAQ
jgi:signal transduction histidine kinase